MKLFGFALVSAQYVTTLQTLNESLSVDNQNLAGQLNALKTELAREQSNHNRALAAFNDMKASYNLMEDKFKGEVAILEHELKELRDQKAEIEQERVELVKVCETLTEGMLILKKKYDQLNMTVGDIVGPWKAKVAQLNGRLGAYKKKFGELPHRRENDRKRKESLTKPSQGEGC